MTSVAQEIASDGEEDPSDSQEIASGRAADPSDVQEIATGREDGYLDDGEGSSEKEYMENFRRVKKPAEGRRVARDRCNPSGRWTTSEKAKISKPE